MPAKKEKNIPSIRFKGFTNAWEQRKLGDIVTRVLRKNTDLKSTLILTISAQYGLVDQFKFFNNRVASNNISNYYLLKKGDFAYNKSYSEGYPFGVVKCLENYDMGVISTLYIVFVPNNDLIKSKYLTFYYETNNWHKQIAEKATEGARNHGLLNISADNFFDTKLNIAKNLKEQEKIGGLFQALDKLITLHQRKCEKLKNIKKSLLEKMFPKNNEKIPAVRFKGFTGDWEQRKLGEICYSFEYGLNVPAIKFDGVNKYIRITDIDDESHLFKTTEITSPKCNLVTAEKYKLSIGDILFARTGASVGKTYIYKKSDGIMYFAGFLIRAKVKEMYISDFIFQNTLTTKFLNFVNITSQRSGQPGINSKEYSEFTLTLPSKTEQKKIGELFQNIDKLITLYQNKLEKLQDIKKALLEKMFI